MKEFKFGDYPYNNEIIEIPERQTKPVLDVYTCPKYYFSEEFLYSLNDNIEKWKNPEPSEMFWFRWVTGHQTMLLFWHLLSKELLAINQTVNLIEIEAKVHLCKSIFASCSVVFGYTGSCPVHLYHSTIRPYMAAFHRCFSGKWSADYEPIPQLVNQIIKTDYPDRLKISQQELKQSFLQHQKSHYDVAKRLVPSNSSLLKDAKNIELELRSTEQRAILFDYFFLVKRVTHESQQQLLQSLSRRIKAIILDISLNGIGDRSNFNQPERAENRLSHSNEDPRLVLFQTVRAIYTSAIAEEEMTCLEATF